VDRVLRHHVRDAPRHHDRDPHRTDLRGLLNLLLAAPVWLQMIHLLLADMLWISLVLMSAERIVGQALSPNAT